MKILFVSSGNTEGGISPLVKDQGASIAESEHIVEYFTIKGGGLRGYLKAIGKLRSYLKAHSFDLLHAHYGLSALTAWLGKRGLPLVVSFMGDDVMGSKRPDGSVILFSRLLIQLNRFMARFFYDAVIVKSEEMKERLGVHSIGDMETDSIKNVGGVKNSPPSQVSFDPDPSGEGDKGVVENESQSNYKDINFDDDHGGTTPAYAEASAGRPDPSPRDRGKLLKRRGGLFSRLRKRPTIHVIPNGVNLEQFYPEEKAVVRERMGISREETIVLFVSNPSRPEKNYPLAESAVELLNRDGETIRLQALYGEDRDTVRDWMNAADVMLLTSYHEGSPNVIKESMACNCSVVSTDVGDVKDVIRGVEGCAIGSYEPKEFAVQLKQEIQCSRKHGRTSGREQIRRLGLDEGSIAERIVGVYKGIVG